MREFLKLHLSQMKILDVLIILVLFLVSFAPYVVHAYNLSQIDEDARIVATITIAGEEVYSVELAEDTPHEEFTLYPAEGQYNVIEVDGERIRNKEDNSPDQIGVRRGWISQPGETAVVLPHQLIIEISAEMPDGERVEDPLLQEEGIIIPQ